jgi:SAM-dependent methyltransferase
MSTEEEKSEFDQYVADYDVALAQGISVSGEDKDFFARRRVAWLERCLAQISARPKSVLDFGCGTGGSSPHFVQILAAEKVLGVDVSQGLLGVAQREFASAKTGFVHLKHHCPSAEFDLAFCNGVFHHIPPADRPAAVRHVFRSLKPGGIFAFWENNPWNPGTRYVMSRITFDRDAIMLSPPEARRLLRESGFEILSTTAIFLFPRRLGWLRWLEPLLARWPAGAQYQVLALKPS